MRVLQAGGVCCLRRRGEWWTRLSLDLEHLGRPDESLEVSILYTSTHPFIQDHPRYPATVFCTSMAVLLQTLEVTAAYFMVQVQTQAMFLLSQGMGI